MVKDLLVQTVTADKVVEVVKKQLTMTGREVMKRLPSFQDATIKWLDQYQKGRFEVFVDTSDLAKEVGRLKSWGRQIVVAIILVGIIIGSAIAMGAVVAAGSQERYRVDFLQDQLLRLSAGHGCRRPHRPEVGVALAPRPQHG